MRRLPLFSSRATPLKISCFAGGVALGCWALGRFTPFPEVPQVTRKLAFYGAHHQQFDTLFIGSSRTNRQLNPALFDEVAREHGVQCRSFNFGLDGMFAPEDGYIADRIVALRPRLKCVVIELSPFHAETTTRTLGARANYWRDWKRTRITFTQFFDRRTGPWRWSEWQAELQRRVKFWSGFADYLGPCLQNLVNIGRGAAMFQKAFGLEQQQHPGNAIDPLGPRQDGFNALSRAEGLRGKARATYEQSLEERRAREEPKPQLGPGGNANITEMVAQFRSTGAEVVLVLAPTVSRPRAYPNIKRLPPIHDFTDVEEWPELFAPEHRYDWMHLNSRGTELYTRALAERIFGDSPPRR